MTWEMGASIDIEKKGRMEGVKECEERKKKEEKMNGDFCGPVIT